MILNVSGRTDIVAFYSDWFMNRYHEGYVDVRNPFYPKLVNRIFFKDVDVIVFCTKNPIPMLDKIKEIKIPILFHITITPYKKEIEPNVVPKGKVIEAVKTLSKLIGKEHIYIRYDPIFISQNYTLEYHKKAFGHLCSLLNGYIEHIIISFLDDYKNVRKNKNILNSIPFTEKDYEEIGKSFSKSALENGMTIQTCAEEKNLIEYGFIKSDCVTHSLLYQLTGKTNFKTWKARKMKCHCAQMVDIGSYNTCKHLCKYCYANYEESKIQKNNLNHDKSSSLLIGTLENDDQIKVRR